MKKNKNFIFNFLIIIFIAGFVSCGKDEPAVYEKGNLIGNYVGNCTVSLSSGSQTVSDFPAEFRQKDTQNLNFNLGDANSYQSIGIFITMTASGFKDYGSYAGFNLENISDSFTTNLIPDFIKNNIKPGWDMKSVTLKLNIDSKNPPKYVIISKNLTFTYTGSIEIAGPGSNDKYSSSITYKFDLTKK